MDNPKQPYAIELWIPGLNEWRTVPVDRYPTIEAAQAEIAAALSDCEGYTLRVDRTLFKVERGQLWRMSIRRGWRKVEAVS